VSGNGAALLVGDAGLQLWARAFGGRCFGDRHHGGGGFGRWRRWWNAQGTSHLLAVAFIGVDGQVQQTFHDGADAHALGSAQPDAQIRTDGGHLFGGATLTMGAQPRQRTLLALGDVVGL
jgi:hypothetical protein